MPSLSPYQIVLLLSGNYGPPPHDPSIYQCSSCSAICCIISTCISHLSGLYCICYFSIHIPNWSISSYILWQSSSSSTTQLISVWSVITNQATYMCIQIIYDQRGPSIDRCGPQISSQTKTSPPLTCDQAKKIANALSKVGTCVWLKCIEKDSAGFWCLYCQAACCKTGAWSSNEGSHDVEDPGVWPRLGG